MEMNEFEILSEEEQIRLINFEATFLMTRFESEKNLSINLYMLSQFYVEVTYNYDINKYVRLLPFNSLDRLIPFIDRMHPDLGGMEV